MSSTRLNILFACMLLTAAAHAQFPPAAGLQGSTAIHKDDAKFKAWATACIIERGYQDIADTSLGYTTVGDGTSATAKAGTTGVVSLGDGGVATLTFESPIYNADGFDFAVFENGFTTGGELAFLEFAFVEVSSDGINFFRFPAITNIPDTVQMAMAGTDCSKVNNLAGKYVNGYGTPFDLNELKNTVGLDVNNVTHVRIIDVVGSIDSAYATYDSQGHKVNDPYPTAFASGGFDLDAVGVINQVGTPSSIQNTFTADAITVFPNPAVTGSTLNITTTTNNKGETLTITDALGRTINKLTIDNSHTSFELQNTPPGIYFITLQHVTRKLVVK